MYIEPNSTIKIIYQCPLDASYENTLWFDTVADQITYFQNTLGGYTFSKQSYQRVTKKSFRIAKPAEEMYDCNYLAFRNISFGTKWFYAFIDKIEYVNNVTSEITYTIDVLQTWHFDYSMEQCFVEREHSVTDEIGDNIVDEGLDTGEYVADDMIFPEYENSKYNLAIWSTFYGDNYADVAGVIYGPQANEQPYMSGLYPNKYPLTQQGLTSALTWINGIPALKLSGLVSACVIPEIADYQTPVTIGVSKSSGIRRNTGLVKNNKLYTYPYNFLYATDNQGKSAVFRYEFFDREYQNCDFKLFCDNSPNPTLTMWPVDYKGVTDNYDERLDMRGFPQVSFNVDSYKAWLAQSASSIALSSLAGAAAAATLPSNFPGMPVTETALAPYSATTAAVGSALGGISGLIGAAAIIGAIRTEINGIIHASMPPQAKGNQGGMMLVGLDIMKFGFMHKHITEEYATIIDDFFTMYGYATKKVKYPNRSSRPEWNYVKTIGCKIRSGIPSDDATTIEGLYDRGIRFWKNPQHIGNYTFDNSPENQNNPDIPSE